VSAEAIITARGLTKRYVMGAATVDALAGVDFDVARGDYKAIMGKSGSGKSTLLHLLGCLDRPTNGSYELAGVDVASLSDRELSRLRNERIGFVFQTFNLVAELSVLENVTMPFLYGDVTQRDARDRAEQAIERVGLAARSSHRPAELSGGEMQRVAVARALAIEPLLILADEPTGNLDSKTGQEILALFDALHAEGTTLVVVTHDASVAARAQETLVMRDGRFVTEGAAA